ncbi:MAG TPA: glycerol-3-phosphate 1-O-acyltransferase PlsY [Anaerolineae bacterium]|nr:glycerol-3-phosphate 1-O-acyltransferase PlsY [Anaerolineae bacterium]
MIFRYFLVALIGYLIGSIPMGLLIGKWCGVDVRQLGSGRTGGTNVYRAAGIGPAILTALLDIAKGALAVLIARMILPSPSAMVLAGLGAVMGHNWSCYIRFRGGAGTAPSLGALLLLSPLTFFIATPLGLIALVLSRYASVGSMVISILAALSLVILILSGRLPREYLLYAVGQAALIFYALRPNIQRLRAGTERRLG